MPSRGSDAGIRIRCLGSVAGCPAPLGDSGQGQSLWYHVADYRMTPKKAAVYLGSATVLVAWLATAGVPEQQPPPAADPAPVETSGTESLAQEVQAQAVRLRERLASAPAPQAPARNPFAFAARPEPRARAARNAAPTAPPAPMVLPEPGLELVGMAEDQSPQGPVRTAVISAEGGELLMVKVGDFLGARYRVQAIGADTVELTDLTSGLVRRLALR